VTTEQKIDVMMATLSEMQRWQVSHNTEHQMFTRDISDLRKEVYGNGSPGLKARTQTIEHGCAMLRCSRIKDIAGKITVNVISGMVLLFVGWLLILYRNFPQ